MTRRIIQGVIFALFLFYLAWPEEIEHAKTFFRLDAVSVGTGSLAARAVVIALVFAALLLVVTYFMGRVFCGWVCPMGALSDFFDYTIERSPRAHGWRCMKSHLLIVFSSLAAAGIAAVWVLDPLIWISRIASLALAEPDWLLASVLLVAFLGIQIGFGRRGFCRILCPLGALLGTVSSFSSFERKLSESCTHCNLCQNNCRMAALERKSAKLNRAECIHCRDCIDNCPENAIEYRYFSSALPTRPDTFRRQYLLSLGVGAALGLGLRQYRSEHKGEPLLLRPPGALSGDSFGNLCIRCGACIRACPTKTLVPCTIESTPLLYQTPILDTRRGGCAFDCNACGVVCPTGAIKNLPLKIKQKESIGLAEIDRSRCTPFTKGTSCVFCYISCPISAIRLVKAGRQTDWGEELTIPEIDPRTCTGCGLCEANCPVTYSAIRIIPKS